MKRVSGRRRHMVPIAKPYIGKEEAQAAGHVISGGWLAQGPKVREFEEAFRDYVNAGYACAVSSGTAALHLALIGLGVGPGDAVITVSHSFVATANSIRYCGAKPVFIDIDLDTYNMSAQLLKDCIKKDCKMRGGKLMHKSGKIAAIMVVHQMGMPCDLAGILPVARKYDIPVIEDAACALGSEVRMLQRWERIGRPHGDIACFSFHPRKVMTTGEGGMVTTKKSRHDKTIRMLRNQGARVRPGKGCAAQEDHPVIGYNNRLTDVQAAIGIEQLKKMPRIMEYRRAAAELYLKYLGGVSWLKLPREERWAMTNWQSYPVRVLECAPVTRDGLIQLLLENGISTRPGIMNAHQEEPYKGNKPLKNSEKAGDSVILLPLFCALKEAQVRGIAEVIKNV